MKKLILGFLLLVGLVSSSVAGPATKAYYWNILEIGSTQYGAWEDVENRYSTVNDHGQWVYAHILVGGYSNNMVVTFNGSAMQLVQTFSVDVNNDGIVDGWRYIYAAYGNSGRVEVKDTRGYRWGTQDSVYVK